MTTTPAPAFSFPTQFKASISHWWSNPKDAGQLAEEGLVRRGLGTTQLVSPEEATTQGAQGLRDKVAVFRDLLLEGGGVKGSDRKRYVLHMLEVGSPVKEEGEAVTVVTHGYGNGLGFYWQQLQAMTSMPTSRTYFLDWLGMGLSGRPNFPHIKTCDETPAGIEARANAAEAFFVDSLEEFRDRSGIQSMTLVGHSIGGYLSAAYALRHPDRVNKLILISPVGVPLSPYASPKPKGSKDVKKTVQEEGNELAAALEQQMLPSGSQAEEINDLPQAPSTWWTYLWEKNVSPFGVLRATGFMGPSLLSRYASRRFAAFPDTVQSDLFSYLYAISTARGSGEYCLAHILAPGAYARWPLLKRLDKLDIPITFIYGDHDWMDENGGYDAVKKLRAKPVTPETARQKKLSKVVINEHSGHWVHLENPEGFNRIIEKELRT